MPDEPTVPEDDDDEDRAESWERRRVWYHARIILPTIAAVRRKVAVRPGLEFDRQTARISGSIRSTRLSPSEFIILETLFRSKGSFVTTDALISSLWRNADREPKDPAKVISVFMFRLRTKIAAIGTATYIENGWRFGYRLGLRSDYELDTTAGEDDDGT